MRYQKARIVQSSTAPHLIGVHLWVRMEPPVHFPWVTNYWDGERRDTPDTRYLITDIPAPTGNPPFFAIPSECIELEPEFKESESREPR